MRRRPWYDNRMTAPKLTLRHNSQGCFDIQTTNDHRAQSDDVRTVGSMTPHLVKGSEPVEVAYKGHVTYHRRLDANTVEHRTYTATAPTAQALLEQMQAVVNQYFAPAPAAGSTGPGA